MAGHNKWSSIKHRQGARDAKRAKVWTRVTNEITVAARLGDVSTAGKALEDNDDVQHVWFHAEVSDEIAPQLAES